MEDWIFWGGVVLLLLLGGLIFGGITAACRRIHGSLFMLLHLVGGMKSLQQDAPPRSLSGYEPTLLPLIRKDFPDFSATQAKNKVRDYLKQQLKEHKGLTIHNVVIHRYVNDPVEKVIIYQAAVAWKEGDQMAQKRYDIYQTHQLPDGQTAVTANCPNCGAPLGFGAVECEYCGARVVNALGLTWKFTQLIES